MVRATQRDEIFRRRGPARLRTFEATLPTASGAPCLGATTASAFANSMNQATNSPRLARRITGERLLVVFACPIPWLGARTKRDFSSDRRCARRSEQGIKQRATYGSNKSQRIRQGLVVLQPKRAAPRCSNRDAGRRTRCSFQDNEELPARSLHQKSSIWPYFLDELRGSKLAQRETSLTSAPCRPRLDRTRVDCRREV